MTRGSWLDRLRAWFRAQERKRIEEDIAAKREDIAWLERQKRAIK